MKFSGKVTCSLRFVPLRFGLGFVILAVAKYVFSRLPEVRHVLPNPDEILMNQARQKHKDDGGISAFLAFVQSVE